MEISFDFIRITGNPFRETIKLVMERAKIGKIRFLICRDSRVIQSDCNNVTRPRRVTTTNRVKNREISIIIPNTIRFAVKIK